MRCKTNTSLARWRQRQRKREIPKTNKTVLDSRNWKPQLQRSKLGYFTPAYFWALFYVGLLGLGWDILYNYLQRYLFDHDWSGVLQFFGAIAEGIVLILLIKIVGLPHIPQTLNPVAFLIHYSKHSFSCGLPFVLGDNVNSISTVAISWRTVDWQVVSEIISRDNSIF